MAGGRLVERHQDKSIDLWRARHMIQDHGAVACSFDEDNPGRLSRFATLADRDPTSLTHLRRLADRDDAFAQAAWHADTR